LPYGKISLSEATVNQEVIQASAAELLSFKLGNEEYGIRAKAA
jgi:chemotaxis signal transduction protein